VRKTKRHWLSPSGQTSFGVDGVGSRNVPVGAGGLFTLLSRLSVFAIGSRYFVAESPRDVTATSSG
jgi:hypothetical protein